MFTGLIEAVGKAHWIRATDRGTQLQIDAPTSEAIRSGDSIAVNGCCLTVTAIARELPSLRSPRGDARPAPTCVLFAAKPETSSAARRRRPLGGHFVQGHVDATARVLSYDESGRITVSEVGLPADCAHYIAYKGSVALNGVSLTVAELHPQSFVVWVIPHTNRQPIWPA